MLLKNKGGNYRRADGTVVKHGETFAPSDLEYSRMLMRGQIGPRFEEVKAAEAPAKVEEHYEGTQTPPSAELDDESDAVVSETVDQEPPASDVPTTADTPSETEEGQQDGENPETEEVRQDGDSEAPEAWTLRITPEQYLARFPDGPQAALARKLAGTKEA